MNEEKRLDGIAKYFEELGPLHAVPDRAEPPGARDWDYVTMADYTKDMAEATQRTRNIIARHKLEIREKDREIAESRRIIGLLTKQLGGDVLISSRDLYAKRDDLVLEWYEDQSALGWRLKAKWKP